MRKWFLLLIFILAVAVYFSYKNKNKAKASHKRKGGVAAEIESVMEYAEGYQPYNTVKSAKVHVQEIQEEHNRKMEKAIRDLE